jgi:hypothetical protein
MRALFYFKIQKAMQERGQVMERSSEQIICMKLRGQGMGRGSEQNHQDLHDTKIMQSLMRSSEGQICSRMHI